MEAPLVSIIVPVYKAEKWLHRCVDSILAQTMTDFELLLIDDGSPDKSGEICDEYASKDDRIKVIHQENKGSVGARNAGLATAKGEYLAFVDSDDYVREDMLRKMVDVAERDNLDIVWCGVEGELMDKSVFSLFEVKDDFDFMIKQLFNGKIQGWLWNKLIKRDFWRQCDIKVDEKYSVLEDVLISLQLFYNNPKQVVVEEYFYVYNRTNENSYTVGAGMFVKSIGNINLIHKFLVDKNLLELYKREFSEWVLPFKIALLNTTKNMNLASDLLSFTHRDLSVYPSNLSLLKKIFYWIVFNCGVFGCKLFYLLK